MSEGFSARTSAKGAVNRLAVGDTVRIVRGALEGATGVVQGKTDGRRFVLALQGVQNGVYAIVAGDAIKAANPTSKAASPTSRASRN